MPLCKPNSAVFKTGWKEIQRSDYCVLEQRGDSMWRIATISPPRIIATSNVSEEDMMIDWDYIHNSVLPTFDESDQTTGELIDFVATTVERMEEEAAAEEALQEVDDEEDEEDVPMEDEEEPEEEEAPALPAGLMPAARPSARRGASAAVAAPEEPEQPQEAEPEPEPGLLEEEEAPPALPAGLMPAARPSSRRKETSMSAIPPVVAHKPTGTAPIAVKPAVAPAPANKLDKGVVEQMKSLEGKRSKFMKSLEPAFVKYRAALEAAHAEFAEEMKKMATANGFDRETCDRIMRSENGGFLSVLNTQLLRENAPGVKCLEEQIEASNKGYQMRQSVLTIQRAYRAHVFRTNVADMSKASFRREKAAREIVESEEAYVSNLQLIMVEYYKPLKKMMAEKKMITPQQFKELFLNLDQIVEFNVKVLAAFKERMKNYDNRKTCIGDVFLKFTEMSKLYSEFVSTFDKSSNVLNQLLENPEFAKWQEDVAMQPQLHRMRIGTLLIMPVQRVPRYMLLIRELIAKTPESHPDYAPLKKAMDFVSNVASGINEAKRRVEAHEKVSELQEHFKSQLPGLVRPFRSLVYEGPGARDTGAGIKPCYLILLTDQLLVTKGKNKYKIISRMILLNAQVTELPENRDSKWQFGFSLSTPKATVNFYLDFENECAKWIGLLEDTIKELPGILTKYPRDRDQLTVLANKGRKEPDSVATAAHVKEIITICDEIVKVQAELMQMPIDLRTMFPQFYAQLHPDHIQHLRARIEALGAKLVTLDKLNKRATELVKSDQAFFQVDKLVSEAMPYLEAMKAIITKAFPKVPGAPRLPKSRDPQLLMRYILFWYVKLCEAWQVVTDLSV